MNKVITLILLAAFATGFLTGCKKKDKGDPPVIPPVESMEIDFRNFEYSGKSGDAAVPGLKGIENSNWVFAAGVAMIWKGVIVTSVAVPAAALKAALTRTPVYLDNKKWQWTYNVTVSVNQVSTTYKARLTGQIQTNSVVWEMYISREGAGAFPEFLWFSGTSKPDASSGQWTVNHSSQYPEPVFQIDWIKSGATVGKITFTYVRALNNLRVPDPFKTSYIEYGTATGNLNAYYKVYYKNEQGFASVDVEWSTAGKHGRVRSVAWFGNPDWYCWDENYVNISCQ